MIDWSRIEGFDWDEGNRSKNFVKHGVENVEAEQAFQNEPLIIASDALHSQGEVRFKALGRTNAWRRLFIAFTLRSDETLIRVISARDMDAKERKDYEQEGP
jgi:uncharacterized DUF497 family protein